MELAMRTILKSTIGCALILALSLLIAEFAGDPALAQQKNAATGAPTQPVSGPNTLSQAQIDAIISAFSAKETQFRRALNEYAFKRDALIQEIGQGGQIVGEYHRVSNFTFDDRGNRFEKIGFFPMATLQGISITPEDLEDLGGVNPFAIEAAKLDQYNLKYIGKERIDELNLYVFDIAPKVIPKKTMDRFFIGRIWVDDQDLQIVKSKGKATPETKTNKFPIVETYREQIDDKYWFPTYVYADDDLIFENTNVRIRMLVKYSDYKKGRATVTVRELDEVKPETQPRPEASSQPAVESRPIEGGIVNGKAIELPAPKYPPEARKAHLSGQVQVKILIDETGKVISAEAVFGPAELREASVEAAMRARFTPTLVAGVPAKVSGVIIYNFVAQ
jgi:TonB family protein